MNQLVEKKSLPLLIILGIGTFWFFLTKDNYFHWDEWVFFIKFKEPLLQILSWPYGEHYIPLNYLNHYLLFKIFGLNYLAFQISVILFHLLNCWLLFKILRKVTGRQIFALAGLVIFGISNLYNENLIWSQGVSNVGSATFVSLAYWSFLNYLEKRKTSWLITSLISLLLSPLFHDLSVLFPFSFVAISLYKFASGRLSFKVVVTYFLVGSTNILLLWHFASQNIAASSQGILTQRFWEIPIFIIVGILRGNFIRFLYPGFHLIQGQQDSKTIFFLFLLGTILTASGKILWEWLKKQATRRERVEKLATYLLLIMTGYLAASFGRASTDLGPAGISRYTYQSFFFILILFFLILKDFPKWTKWGLLIISIFGVMNLISLINFQNNFWKVMVSRDRQFTDDVRYLFSHNDRIYDLPAKGIHPTISLSKLWFLYPSDHSLTFLSPQLMPTAISEISSDKKTKEIYFRFKSDYQKKFD